MRYTLRMETLVILAVIVVLVAIDAIGRLDERRPRRIARDETQKISVDLTKRH